ncbi:MAG: hypothetical protein HZA54_04335 [Planctomycetes bacterium]|nr:hypothetical protein [Planctomycetota bacterium]
MPSRRNLRALWLRLGPRGALLLAALLSLPFLAAVMIGRRPESADRLMARAGAARAANDLPVAIQELRTLLLFHPRHPLVLPARCELAKILVQLVVQEAGRSGAGLSAAIDACEDAAEAGAPADTLRPLRDVLSRYLAIARRWNDAARQSERLLEGVDGFSPLLLDLARARARSTPPDVVGALAALDRYDAGASADRDRARGLDCRGSVLAGLERQLEAAQAYRALADRYPEAPEAFTARLEAGRAYLAAARYADASADLARARLAFEGTGEEAEVVLLLARVHLAEGDPRGALALLAAIPRDVPGRSVTAAFLLEAGCRLDLDDPAAARADLARAADGTPDPATDTRLVARDVERLAARLEDAEALQPILDLARRLAAAAPGGAARVPLLRAVVGIGSRLGARAGEAALHARAGRDPVGAATAERVAAGAFETVARTYEEIESAAPGENGSGGSALDAGRAHLRAGHPLLSLTALRRYFRLCLTDDPRTAEALWLLGAGLAELGRLEEAEAAFARCAAEHGDAFPFGAHARLAAGRCRLAASDPVGAARHFADLVERAGVAPAEALWRVALVELGTAQLAASRRLDRTRPVPPAPEPGELSLLDALGRFPDDPAVVYRARAELGLRAFERGDLETAERELDAALDVDAFGADEAATAPALAGARRLGWDPAFDDRVRLARADCRARRGRWVAAAGEYRALADAHAAAADPLGTRALVGLLTALRELGRTEELAAAVRIVERRGAVSGISPSADSPAPGGPVVGPLVAALRAELAALTAPASAPVPAPASPPATARAGETPGGR